MKNLLLKQAVYTPALYFGTLILAGLFAVDYSHVGQHASEIAVNGNKTAGSIFNIGIAVTAISLIMYGAGLLVKFKTKFLISSILVIIFGVSFLFGAIYVIGSPLHGLYGIGLSIMMLPFAFLYELNDKETSALTRSVGIISAVIIFIYFWTMAARLDPVAQRGLTQRIFGLIVFGFISYSAYVVAKIKE